MKKIVLICYTAIAAVLFTQCNTNSVKVCETLEDSEIFGENLADDDLVGGKIIVRVSNEFAEQLEDNTGENGDVILPGVKSISSLSGVKSMTRLFPYAEEFEPRTRAEGLHLWYIVRFDTDISTKSVGRSLLIPGVEEIEYCPKIKIIGDPVITSIESSPSGIVVSATTPFNDPLLHKQWHYYNDGTANSSVSGCDINVFPAWSRYKAGAPNVIVAVVDQGVDYKHEDLAANMWHNPKQTGDKIYGHNFVSGTDVIHPGEHGTHVAGTIAAVNNNGKGVCGIAGGDSKKSVAGVKIMSCQIFDTDGGKEKSGDGATAIKWAADHGAVVAQNSWGWQSPMKIPSTLKAAVEYFEKYAGLDANGTQTGPMKGGVVIFAAGNDNIGQAEGTSYPGVIINVGSVGADFRRAYYSNFGDWVDISAPGGDAHKGNQVYSTLPNNKYGLMQGTSMACPHVSGVAALIIANKGGLGYDLKALKSVLLTKVTPISSYNNVAMGSGLVNAFKALSDSDTGKPETPTQFSVSSKSNTINVSVKIPYDSDKKSLPSTIYVFYSKEPGKGKDAMFSSFYTDGKKVGDIYEGCIRGLEFNTEYYLTACAGNIIGNLSELTSEKKITTGENSAPIIEAKDGLQVTVKPNEKAALQFSIIEPDAHFYNIELIAPNQAAVLDTLDRENPIVRITGKDADSGSYVAKLTVTDIYGAVSSKNIDYTILENHKPYVGKKFENMIFNSKSAETVSFRANEYFKDDDGEDLSYTITIIGETVSNCTISKGTFYITPMNYGYSDITITGNDVRGESVTQTFKVLVRDGKQPIDVYPNPVSDYLYIRTSEDVEADISIFNSFGAEIFSTSGLKITPFEPGKIDVTSYTPGIYCVKINIQGMGEIKYNIVKL